LLHEDLMHAMNDATVVNPGGSDKIWVSDIPLDLATRGVTVQQFEKTFGPFWLDGRESSTIDDLLFLQRALRVPTPRCPEPWRHHPTAAVSMTPRFIDALTTNNFVGYVLRWVNLALFHNMARIAGESLDVISV
jgi:hypothetical protein